MWTVPKPNIRATEAFDLCIRGISTEEKKLRLQGIRQQIEAAEAEFDARGAAVELHLIQPTVDIAGTAGTVTAHEMSKLYDRHMARNNSRGNEIYSKVMLAAKHGQCPFCGHLPVSTLDHSLPKSDYPLLAVTPINLIPCCKDCNHYKGTLGPEGPETQLFNAYFDDVTGDRWLYARMIHGAPAGVSYYVDAPHNWSQTTISRARRHFQRLKIGKLYASLAGSCLQSIRKSMVDHHRAGGAFAVSEELLRRSESCAAVNVNSWDRALYEAASNDPWYCEGGFGL